MPEDNKVFDVAKPGRSAPAPTSRPIIVGQRSTGVDTMMKDSPPQPSPAPALSSTTPIHVSMADEEPVNVMARPSQPDIPAINSGPGPVSEMPPHSPVGATIPPHELDETPQSPDENAPGSNFTPLTTLIPNYDSKEDTGSYGAHHVDNLPQNHDGDPGWREAPPLPVSKGAGPKRRWPKVFMWLLILMLIAGVGAYLAIDDGLVQSDVKLPFHIFNKQKTSAATTTKTTVVKTTPPASPPPVESSVPAGFTNYKVDESGVSFAYPTAWGTPTVTKDPGFSKRGGTNKSDSTHAYLVAFATNKDVQVALTSSQYLPAARPANATAWYYYDYLQWCAGTNDSKFYKQTMHFATDASKVDTPGTVACDQGPLTDATKLDDTTIIQSKTSINSLPQTQSFVSVDLYTKNLTSSKTLPVLRVKDAAMKNSDDIKKLLSTVKVATSTSTPTGHGGPCDDTQYYNAHVQQCAVQ
jgi:hypothetical protein